MEGGVHDELFFNVRFLGEFGLGEKRMEESRRNV